MRSLLRRSIKPVAARLYRYRPITSWPKWAGDVLEVKTPANLTNKAAFSPEGGSNINIILALLDRTRDVPGDVAECGVFKGSSLTAIALYVRENGFAKHIFGLDSFRGFDESVRKDIALVWFRPLPSLCWNQSSRRRKIAKKIADHRPSGRVGPGNFTPSLSQIRT